MLLAGDVGGTKTLLGVFERAPERPRPIAVRAYPTQAFPTFTAILTQFARDLHQPVLIEAAVVGVAGPVVANRARLTNIVWDIAADEITACFGTRHVQLLNDLEAMATSVDVLTPDEYVLLQAGVPRADGNAAVIAAGTGLGQAYLHRVGGRMRALPSEGGHADFAARTDREMELVRMLSDRYGRAEVEHVLSGPGLVNLHRFTHRGGQCEILDGASAIEAPARITQAGTTGRCQGCAEALQLFVSAYGAEAGNLALRGVTTSGLYVGGGIAPRILPILQSGRFMDAFLAKPPMVDLLSRIPVKVILNTDAGLLGAAVSAQALEQSSHAP
jgi:glucokinase